MARLQRSVRELESRQEKAMRDADAGPAAPALEIGALARFDWGLVFSVFAALSVVTIIVDTSLAMMRNVSPRLGFGWSVMVGAGAASVFAVYLRLRLRPQPVPTIDRERLAHAIQHEREIAADATVRLEHLEIDPSAAWIVLDGRQTKMVVLDCGDGTFVLVRGPLLEAHGGDAWIDRVPGRWSVNALRWTRVVTTLIVHGTPVPARRIDLDARVVLDLRECEVRTRSELPATVAKALADA